MPSLLCSAIVALALGASARTPPTETPNEVPLTMRDAIERFEQFGYDLLLADTQVKVAEGDYQAALRPPNPLFSMAPLHTVGSYTARGCPAGQCSVWGFQGALSDQGSILQLLTNKRGLRKEALGAALEAARHDRDDAQRTLENQVKLQVLTVAIEQARLKFVEDLSATYKESSSLFLARYDAGDISEADLARVEVDGLSAEQAVNAARAQLADNRAVLSYLLGERDQSVAFRVIAPWLEAQREQRLTRIEEKSYLDIAHKFRPDYLSELKQLRQAEATLHAAVRARIPDASVVLSYQQQGTGQQAAQPPTFGLGLSLELPVLYQQQGEVARARAALRSEQVQLAQLEAQLAADVHRAFVSLGFAHARVDRARGQQFPRAARALRLVQLQYAKGAASLIELLAARRTLLDVKQAYFDAVGDYWGAVLALELAINTEVRL